MLFWLWLGLEASFIAAGFLLVLKGDLAGTTLAGILTLICQNNRIAEAAKDRERLRHYGGHR